MVKNDINLFKASGGDRAKGGKKSPVKMIGVLTLVVTIAAVGVAAYFNINKLNAESAYNEKAALLENYNLTKTNPNVISLSDEWNKIISDIASAKAINEIIDVESKLYPHATNTEVAAIKATVLKDSVYSFNEIVEGEKFTPIDYSKIKNALLEDQENRELFYYALENLENDQNAKKKENVWYSYYRGYFTMVFKGGEGGTGLESLASQFDNMSFQNPVDDEIIEGIRSPFMKIKNGDNSSYDAVKYTYVPLEEEAYNVMLCPMKNIIERLFDVLDDHAANLAIEDNLNTEELMETIRYSVDSISYSKSSLELRLTLNSSDVFPSFCTAFNNSGFFSVSNDVVNTAESKEGNKSTYKLILFFNGEY